MPDFFFLSLTVPQNWSLSVPGPALPAMPPTAFRQKETEAKEQRIFLAPHCFQRLFLAHRKDSQNHQQAYFI